jgi:hypothetical protein
VLEDFSDELQAGVDRRIAVRPPVAMSLALHRADEIFEVRDCHLVEAHAAKRWEQVVLQERVLVDTLRVGEAAGDALPLVRAVHAQRGHVTRQDDRSLRMQNRLTEDLELLQQIVPTLHGHDFALARMPTRTGHTALEDSFLRALLVGLQAGRSLHGHETNNAVKRKKSYRKVGRFSERKRSTSSTGYTTSVLLTWNQPVGPFPSRRHFASVAVLMPRSCATACALRWRVIAPPLYATHRGGGGRRQRRRYAQRADGRARGAWEVSR